MSLRHPHPWAHGFYRPPSGRKTHDPSGGVRNVSFRKWTVCIVGAICMQEVCQTLKSHSSYSRSLWDVLSKGQNKAYRVRNKL
jgi:hypothetical protein